MELVERCKYERHICTLVFNAPLHYLGCPNPPAPIILFLVTSNSMKGVEGSTLFKLSLTNIRGSGEVFRLK